MKWLFFNRSVDPKKQKANMLTRPTWFNHIKLATTPQFTFAFMFKQMLSYRSGIQLNEPVQLIAISLTGNWNYTKLVSSVQNFRCVIHKAAGIHKAPGSDGVRSRNPCAELLNLLTLAVSVLTGPKGPTAEENLLYHSQTRTGLTILLTT